MDGQLVGAVEIGVVDAAHHVVAHVPEAPGAVVELVEVVGADDGVEGERRILEHGGRDVDAVLVVGHGDVVVQGLVLLDEGRGDHREKGEHDDDGDAGAGVMVGGLMLPGQEGQKERYADEHHGTYEGVVPIHQAVPEQYEEVEQEQEGDREAQSEDRGRPFLGIDGPFLLVLVRYAEEPHVQHDVHWRQAEEEDDPQVNEVLYVLPVEYERPEEQCGEEHSYGYVLLRPGIHAYAYGATLKGFADDTSESL
jgi:hypothetical protein